MQKPDRMDHSYELRRGVVELARNRVGAAKYLVKHVLPNLHELRRTATLRDTKKNKFCFIFGNGPSMQRLDLERVAGYQERGFDIFCVNSFISSDFADHLTPNYYVATDPGYYGARGVGVDLSEEVARKIPKQIDLLNERRVINFVPLQFKHGNQFKHTYYFNDFENLFSGNINLLWPRGYVSLSVLKALAAACFMGYEKKYVCGFDHSYHQQLKVDENNRLSYVNDHFYNSKGVKTYLDEYQGGIADYFWEAHVTFKNFHLFRNHQVINLMPDGFVDAFSKKVDIDVLKP